MVRKRRLLRGLALLLAALLAASACGGRGETLSGTLAVYTDDAVIIEEVTVQFKDGDTVLDILKKAAREARVHMEYSGAGKLAYVKGIDNLYEFDKGPESGWKYFVNGEEMRQSAGAYKPGEGDIICWRYVLTL